jgi:methionyl-tRNA formyltransferase
MRLIFAGTPLVAADTLQHLLLGGEQVVAGVLTRPDAPVGRSRTPQPSPVAAVAEAHGLPVCKSASAKSDAVAQWVRELAPDIAAVVAYGGLIPGALLRVPEHGWVNVHYSLLPKWRGAAPVQHAIMAGDTTTGVSVFELVEELDAGPVYRQVEVEVGQSNAGELLARLTEIGAQALLDVFAAITAGTALLAPQNSAGATFAPKLTPESARIDWSGPAAEIERQVRGCNPAPMAWTLVNGERFRVLSAVVADSGDGLAPAQLRLGPREVRVGTGVGELLLNMVQPAGKKPMRATDWARGLREHPVITSG